MGDPGTELMAVYTIGEVEEITGVKANNLRYWETVIPGLAPKKDLGGHRAYSQRNVDIILRMKYLISQKKYTIEGARERILEDTQAASNGTEVLQVIYDIRSDLTDAFLTIRKYRPKKEQTDEQT